jgi:hypothetical protein
MRVPVSGRSRRCGITRIEVAVVVVILIAAAALLLPLLPKRREDVRRGNTCRSNMRALSQGLFIVAMREGSYPGYMNVLKDASGKPFTDPTIAGSSDPLPVSWAVMILPEIDRRPTYDQWIKAPRPQATPSGMGPLAAAPPATRYFTDQYIDIFLCPSDFQLSKTGTPISFVVNTGLPDRATATPIEPDGSGGRPRDWKANGMFFDHFSEHELVKSSNRGPMVRISDEQVADPKDKTILLTENVDATSYVLTAAAHGADNWKAAEVQLGCIWRPGNVDASTNPPTMTPPVRSLHINRDIGKGTGTSYDYCRPSSRHPQTVNVAYVGTNVAALNDKISYFIYAQLMASDDANAGLNDDNDVPIDPAFRTYELSNSDVYP